MLLRHFTIWFLLMMPLSGLLAQCEIKENAFEGGEKLTYKISYNWGFIWLNAGEVYFKTDTLRIKNRKTFHFDSYGSTYPNYDWIFKVRDHYQAFTDATTFKPLKFERNVSEGSNITYNKYLFDHSSHRVFTTVITGGKPTINDTLKLPECTFDVLSMIYYARNIDYSKYKSGDKIPISIIIDNEIFAIYIRYLGKEVLETHSGEKYNCIKFSPYLVEGTIFSGGEDMNVWVTDDDNKIPVYIEAKILVGSIKVYLSEIKGAKFPIKAKLE